MVIQLTNNIFPLNAALQNSGSYITNNFRHHAILNSLTLNSKFQENLNTSIKQSSNNYSESQNPKKGFWSFIKQHFLHGFLERLFALVIAIDFAHGKNPLITALFSLAGLAVGELLVQFEQTLEKHVESFVNNHQKGIPTNENNWSLGQFIAKAVSLSSLALIGVAKKIWYFYHKSKHHEPNNEFIKKTKQGLNLLTNKYADQFSLDKTEINKKLKDPNTNILESFSESGKWMKQNIGTNTNPFVSAWGKLSGNVLEKLLGCPSVLEGLNKGKLEGKSILKDASLKLAIFVPVSILMAFATDIASNFFKHNLPDDEPDEDLDYEKIAKMHPA